MKKVNKKEFANYIGINVRTIAKMYEDYLQKAKELRPVKINREYLTILDISRIEGVSIDEIRKAIHEQ